MARKADGGMFVPEAEQPYKIPNNWRWVRLGGITDIIGGGTPSTKEKAYYDNGDIPWISPADLSGYAEIYIAHGAKSITRLGLEKSSAQLLPAETVCLSTRAPIGYVAIAKNPLSTNQGFKSFLPSPSYLPRYLYWYLKGNKDLLESRASGTTFLELSGRKAANLEFPLPPLAEQQRIVDRIESLFTKLDAARDNARAVVGGFETRKAAILHRAFSGELTEQWRKGNGVSLNSWTHCKLIDILIEKPRNGYSPKPVDYPTPLKSMTLSATTSGVFLPEHYKYIDEPIPDDSYLWLQPGDILMQRANSIDKVGTSALYTGKAHEFIYPDLMMKLQVKADVSPEYVAYFLKSNSTMLFLRTHAVGIAGNMPKINQKTVSNIPVFLPPFEEQKEIARLLNHLFLTERQVKKEAQQVIDNIDAMKKAILGRAFRGELGANDPSEASPDLTALGGQRKSIWNNEI